MRAAILTVLFITSVSTIPVATGRPDLSGSWAAVKDEPPSLAPAPSPILGPRFSLKQDGETVTWTRPLRDEFLTVTLKFDGTKAGFRIPGRMCEGDSEAFETAIWEDGTLVLTAAGVIPPGGGPARPFNAKRLLKLHDPNTLLVQASMNQAGKPVAVGTVYKRSDPMPPPPAKASAVKGTPATIAQVGWIAGFWTGTTKTTTVEERWTSSASGGMIGLGRTLRGSALASFEFLCIAERDGSLVYQAMPNGRSPATDFTLTAVSADSATFENPAHDFPRLVRYSRLADGSLETAISAGPTQKMTTFVLKKQE